MRALASLPFDADVRVPLSERPRLSSASHPSTPRSPKRARSAGAGPIEVVLHPVAVHFKGSGFYSNGNYGRGGGRKKDAGKEGDSGGGSSEGGSGEQKGQDVSTKGQGSGRDRGRGRPSSAGG